MFFLGRTPIAGSIRVWKIQAPGRCRFFGWPVLHGRCCTSNWLRHHGLRDTDECAICGQEVENLDHPLDQKRLNYRAAGCIVVRRGAGSATASIEGLVWAGDISHPPAQMVPFMLAGGLCRLPALIFATDGWHMHPPA
jgi:hypothetical protein